MVSTKFITLLKSQKTKKDAALFILNNDKYAYVKFERGLFESQSRPYVDKITVYYDFTKNSKRPLFITKQTFISILPKLKIKKKIGKNAIYVLEKRKPTFQEKTNKNNILFKNKTGKVFEAYITPTGKVSKILNTMENKEVIDYLLNKDEQTKKKLLNFIKTSKGTFKLIK